MITTAEIEKIINQSNYGEYDQYHDWNPCYNLQDKAGFLENMLRNWKETEPEAQNKITGYIKNLLAEAGNIKSIILDVLSKFYHYPEIAIIVDEIRKNSTPGHRASSV